VKSGNLYWWTFLALVTIILLGPVPYWLTGIGQMAEGLPSQITHQPDGRLMSSPKAEARHALTLPMRIERIIIYPFLLLSFQLSGCALVGRRWLERQIAGWLSAWPFRNWFLPGAGWIKRIIPHTWRHHLPAIDLLVILAFILIFDLALFLLYLPFNFYRGFVLAHQFGLSTQTALGWFNDWLKSVLITLAEDGLIWTGFYGLLQLFPRLWPIPGGALLLLFSFVFVLLTPILITPLFFEVRPLDDPNLRDRILTLADRAGMRVDKVQVIDASAKTTTVNAYITGFGDARRIVLYDTLLSGYTGDQLEVVLAHEMGHWYYRHVLWSVLGFGAASWIGLFGLRWLLEHTSKWLGLRGPADIAGLPYVMAVVFVASILSLPIQNGISRFGERQADQFALTISQKPEAVITLFEEFAEQNLSLVDTSAWEKLIFYTHPPIAERIRMAENSQDHSSTTNR
jgi:STE24 endopeptidase